MATQSQTLAPRGGWGVRRYHVGFALAFGVGAALLPPDGALTIAGWFGGALGALLAGLVVAGVVVGALRVVEEWRPTHVADPGIPDTRARHLVFAAVVLQLFAVGLGVTAGVSTEGMLYFAGPVNLLVAAAVAIDVTRLRKRGLAWDTVAYGYAVAALLFGFVGGLVYWRARGRKRAEHAGPQGGQGQHPQGGQPPQGGQGQPPAGGHQQGGPQHGSQPPQGGQQDARGQGRQDARGQGQQGTSGQGQRGTRQRGGQNQPRQEEGQQRSRRGSRGIDPQDDEQNAESDADGDAGGLPRDTGDGPSGETDERMPREGDDGA
jgi:hypothetical protein